MDDELEAIADCRRLARTPKLKGPRKNQKTIRLNGLLQLAKAHATKHNKRHKITLVKT